jgi:hypothetical protein
VATDASFGLDGPALVALRSRSPRHSSIDTVNRRFTWLGGAVGALAVWRLLRRKPRPASVTAHDDPADALRARLEESRALVGERDMFEEGETPVDEADPEARRRSVHEQARARIDDLRGKDAV